MCSEPSLSPYLFVSIRIVGIESACSLLDLVSLLVEEDLPFARMFIVLEFEELRADDVRVCWFICLPRQSPLSQSRRESDARTQSTGSPVTSHILVLRNPTGGRAGVESTHKAA